MLGEQTLEQLGNNGVKNFKYLQLQEQLDKTKKPWKLLNSFKVSDH